jgi:hypothetical protein
LIGEGYSPHPFILGWARPFPKNGRTDMNTALVYSPNNSIRDRLRDELNFAKCNVDFSESILEIYSLLKYERRDVLIAEVMKYDFSDLIKFCYHSNSQMNIYLFCELRVFCLYPLGSKPEAIVNAIDAAGIKISPRLLGRPQTLEPVEMALI